MDTPASRSWHHSLNKIDAKGSGVVCTIFGEIGRANVMPRLSFASLNFAAQAVVLSVLIAK